MKRILLCLLLVGCGTSWADSNNLYLQINGRSFHSERCPDTCNENNSGAGFQYGQDGFFYTGGALVNSLSQDSYYLGVSKQYWLTKLGPVSISGGFFAGAIYYPFFKKSDPVVALSDGTTFSTQSQRNVGTYPAILPLLSLSTPAVQTNIIYIPRIKDEVMPAVFMQIAVKLF